MLGTAGPTGATGATGAQGNIGATGAQGPLAGITPSGRWNTFREYNFNVGRDDIGNADSGKASEVAAYLNQNPNARVAIDGYETRRTTAVREELVKAGVPAYKMQVTNSGDPQGRNERRVQVLVSSN